MTPIAGPDDAAAPLSPAVPRAISHFQLLFAVSLIFILPNVILATALRPIPAMIVVAGCAGAVLIMWRERMQGAFLRASADAGRLALCLLLGLSLCLLGGEGHFFMPTTDWLTRDAVLSDLLRNGLTVLYRMGGQDYVLRAPLGMYLLPAMVGRVLGLYAAHLALLAQNSALLGVAAYFITSIADVRRAPMIFLLIGFSGLDLVGLAVGEAVAAMRGANLFGIGHTEWWLLEIWPVRLQFSSIVTQIFWVPNHAAPGVWFATLTLLHLRRAISFPAVLAACGPMLLWSPLAMAGAAPFVLLLAARRPLRALVAPGVAGACAVSLCFLPVAAYLVADAAEVSHEWLILRKDFLAFYLCFLVVEIPQAAVVLSRFKDVPKEDRAVFLLALATLLVLPIYSLGPSNDLAMRASIPALFILAFQFARIAVLTRGEAGALPGVISTLVLLSAATPLMEIKFALVDKPYAISDCNMLTTVEKFFPGAVPTNYLARREKAPAWLVDLSGAPAPLTVEDRTCWPDHPWLEEKFR
ncbi:MAG: hypothetical protein ACR652_14315 [Methylocystis sp.]|uniref:hypothetical protein n=1 Tax=Methylocystis sp. TaxID=1911079 RepID=UPI003DA3642C